MNNIAAATKPSMFAFAPVAAQNRAIFCALVLTAQVAFIILGLAVNNGLGAQMQAMKGFEALIFAVYLVGGSGFSAALYGNNQKSKAAIVAATTSAILAFLGGMLLA